MELRLDSGQILLIDAGTGIRPAGDALQREHGDRPVDADILVSHFHWDHIQGFPFFAPAYRPRNRIRIHGGGVQRGTERMFRGLMDGDYFPVRLHSMGASLSFHDLDGDTFEVGAARVSYAQVHHPGVAMAYRITVGRTSLVYISDHEYRYGHPRGETELPPLDLSRMDPALRELLEDTDLYICEGQYTRAEYPARVGWGHSILEDTMAAAADVKPRRLVLFHHDPDHDDEMLDGMTRAGQRELAERRSEIPLIAAYEGLELELPER